jgi:site-specific DNA-adenine methylase
MKAPFPWFGGKRKVAGLVWERFGNVQNYVEPFFGSGAVLLGRPAVTGLETVNDKDGLVANFWRALQRDPDQVAHYADNPVNENDLHARHVWLIRQLDELTARLEGHPDYYDAKIAGYWVWGVSCWIGGGFCSGGGPWAVDAERRLVLGTAGRGVKRQLPHLGDDGRGVNRQLPHLGDAGQGVNRQQNGALLTYFHALAARLRNVRVCSGDWSRVCGESVTVKHGVTGVFLDPPYSQDTERNMELYRMECGTVAHAVREWAIANGDHPLMRIALCGYESEHAMPDTWECVAWNAGQGYGAQADERSENGKRERIWFSPHCVREQARLF